MNNQNQQQIAFLLDFDNVANAVAPGEHDVTAVIALIQHFQKQGNVSIRRAYGDWRRVYVDRNTARKRYHWQELVESGLDAIQVFPVSGLKNRADIQIAIEAVEIAMRQPDVRVFVIVSGDSDFGPLANMLRALGRYVIGVISHGRRVNPIALRMYDEVVFIEDILNPTGNIDGRRNDLSNIGTSESGHWAEVRSRAPSDDLDDFIEARQSARQLVCHVLRTAFSQPREPIHAGQLKVEMCRVDSAFDARKLGYRNFQHWLLENRDLMTQLRRGQDSNSIYVIPLGKAVPEGFELRYAAEADSANGDDESPQDHAHTPVP